MIEKPSRIKNLKLLEAVRKRNCEGCGKVSTKDNPNQAAHIRSRGAHGDDVEENLLSLCANCHIFQHAYGWKKFLAEKPFLRQTLAQKGWRIAENNKLVRY